MSVPFNTLSSATFSQLQNFGAEMRILGMLTERDRISDLLDKAQIPETERQRLKKLIHEESIDCERESMAVRGEAASLLRL
jgi:hypothetical protein